MTAAELATIVHKDIKRVIAFGYLHAELCPPDLESRPKGYIIQKGKGPKLCLKQSFRDFVNSYLIAQHELYRAWQPVLTAGSIIEVDFHYSIDEENPYGDFGYHVWRITEDEV